MKTSLNNVSQANTVNDAIITWGEGILLYNYKLYRYCEECGFQALQSGIEYENQTILVKNYGIIYQKRVQNYFA